ncbi:MAG: helix-turn-helix domain-containing protein [Pseudomonadota bacterium]
MGRCYGNDLRRRVVEAIDGGLSARAAAARFSVAPSTAIHWHRRWRERGSIEPDLQGQPSRSKLDAHAAFILGLVEETKDIALVEIADRLAQARGLRVHPTTVWYFLSKRGLTHKKRRAMHRNSSARMCCAPSPAPGAGGGSWKRAPLPPSRISPRPRRSPTGS